MPFHIFHLQPSLEFFSLTSFMCLTLLGQRESNNDMRESQQYRYTVVYVSLQLQLS